MGMFAEKKDVIDGVGFASGDEALLQGVGVGVGNQAEVGDEERHSWESENEIVGTGASAITR